MIQGGKTEIMIDEIVKTLENEPNSRIVVAVHDSQAGALYQREIQRRMKWKKRIRDSAQRMRRGEIRLGEQGEVRIVPTGGRDTGRLRGFAPDHVFVDVMCADWVYEAVQPYWPWATSKYDDPDW